ncbi:Thymidine kinase [Spironucleus salmonicida]|uniref:Thymidine kinase n=2 Tax=Spironucleus salmonicida TaxID=348837 RepID=V6LJV3_9EUKA|nr:Thymidine kinase [Spironucleus salmonicida]KAH0574316.1 Thymidine kinase [Spironucleus salmonicida]|eukprot:EST44812.1 Thymidine kinase [Spironucleus salmonicida]
MVILSGGNIQLILGPMFSGKSTELIRRIRKYRAAKRSVLVVKFAADTRYSADQLSTHDMMGLPAVQASRLADVIHLVDATIDVVAIDEGQFYPDLVEHAEALANAGKTVLVTALDGNFLRKPFDVIPPLCALADHVDKLSSVCYSCFQDAPFSARITNDTAEVVIGGADMYVACCRACWNAVQAQKAAE